MYSGSFPLTEDVVDALLPVAFLPFITLGKLFDALEDTCAFIESEVFTLHPYETRVEAQGFKVFLAHWVNPLNYFASVRGKAGVKDEGVVFYDNGLDTFDPLEYLGAAGVEAALEAQGVKIRTGHGLDTFDPLEYLEAAGVEAAVEAHGFKVFLAHWAASARDKAGAKAEGIAFDSQGLNVFDLHEYLASTGDKAGVKAKGITFDNQGLVFELQEYLASAPDKAGVGGIVFYDNRLDTFDLQEYLASACDKAGVKAGGVVFYGHGLSKFEPQKHRHKGNTSVLSCERQYATSPFAMTTEVCTVA